MNTDDKQKCEISNASCSTQRGNQWISVVLLCCSILSSGCICFRHDYLVNQSGGEISLFFPDKHGFSQNAEPVRVKNQKKTDITTDSPFVVYSNNRSYSYDCLDAYVTSELDFGKPRRLFLWKKSYYFSFLPDGSIRPLDNHYFLFWRPSRNGTSITATNVCVQTTIQ